MVYFKCALVGLGTALLGCVAAPIAMLIWASWKTETGATAMSFSPIGLVHSIGFWAFATLLFAVGFIPSMFFLKK
jgi:hypothetical protein